MARSFRGAPGQALVGNQFFLRYHGKPLSALWSIVHTQMPLNAPGTLSSSQSLALVAFILAENGFPPGPSPIVGHYDITRIIPDAAPGASAAVVAGAHAALGPMVVKQPTTNVPAQQELDEAGSDANDWLMYAKDYRGARYSALSEITTANVARLTPVCSVVLSSPGSFEASPSPTMVRFTSPRPTARSPLTARRARRYWSYQYDATDIEAGANRNKGVAIGGGRAIRGTTDGRLIALRPQNRHVLWNRKIMDSSAGASAIAAPLIWHDLVFMGFAGGTWAYEDRSRHTA